jgi:hypothetical protein
VGLEYAAIDGMGQARTLKCIYFIAELACDLQCQHLKKDYSQRPRYSEIKLWRLPRLECLRWSISCEKPSFEDSFVFLI